MPAEGGTITPMWLPEQLEPVVARLARVDDCIFEMGDLSGRWSLDAPLSLQQLRRSDGRYRVVVSEVRAVPPAISLAFSEAVNHLRAALDNVVWHLVVEQAGPLDEKVARKVTMPVHGTSEKFASWRGGVAHAVPVLGHKDSHVYQRIRELQPFTDPAQVPSVGSRLASLMGVDSEDVHPLLLLQAYSNADKHRTIAATTQRSITTSDGSPFFAQDRSLRHVDVGTVMAEGSWGTPVEFDSSAAVVLERPAPWAAVVSPASEAERLRDWVAQRALPLLVTGSPEVTVPLPLTIPLGDDGRTLHQRITASDRAAALERLAEVNARRYTEAMSRPVKFPETVVVEFQD